MWKIRESVCVCWCWYNCTYWDSVFKTSCGRGDSWSDRDRDRDMLWSGSGMWWLTSNRVFCSRFVRWTTQWFHVCSVLTHCLTRFKDSIHVIVYCGFSGVISLWASLLFPQYSLIPVYPNAENKRHLSVRHEAQDGSNPFFLSPLKLGKPCLDKHDWFGMNSRSLCCARLPPCAFWEVFSGSRF